MTIHVINGEIFTTEAGTKVVFYDVAPDHIVNPKFYSISTHNEDYHEIPQIPTDEKSP